VHGQTGIEEPTWQDARPMGEPYDVTVHKKRGALVKITEPANTDH
jgi:hypothetical protein